jgi:hypothetical protein
MQVVLPPKIVDLKYQCLKKIHKEGWKGVFLNLSFQSFFQHHSYN